MDIRVSPTQNYNQPRPPTFIDLDVYDIELSDFPKSSKLDPRRADWSITKAVSQRH